MTTTAHTPTDAEWLKLRSRELRRWVDIAFEDEADGYEVTVAVSKLTRNKPLTAADDQYFQRILLRTDISEEHVFTILTLLVRHRQPDWRQPMPRATLASDEELVAQVTHALLYGSPEGLTPEGTPYNPTEEGGLDASVAVYMLLYDDHAPDSVSAMTLATLVDKIRSMGAERVHTAAALLRRAGSFRPGVPTVPDCLQKVRAGILGQFIARNNSDEALDFYEATAQDGNNRGIAEVYGRVHSSREETFMAGFSCGVRFAEEKKELVEATRAFEADKRWVKRPLDEIRFVPGVGEAGTSPIPLAPELPDGLLARIHLRAERRRAQAEGRPGEDVADGQGRVEVVSRAEGSNAALEASHEGALQVHAEEDSQAAGDDGEGDAGGDVAGPSEIDIPWRNRVVYAIDPDAPLSAPKPHTILDVPVIYQITFKGYQHRYVGYTVGAARRFETHISSARKSTGGTPLVQFMLQVGIWNATMEILEVVDSGELGAREQFWMQKVGETHTLLNVCGNKRQSKNTIRRSIIRDIEGIPDQRAESDCSILAPGGRRYYAVFNGPLGRDRIGFIEEAYYVKPDRIEINY